MVSTSTSYRYNRHNKHNNNQNRPSIAILQHQLVTPQHQLVTLQRQMEEILVTILKQVIVQL